MSCLIWVLIGVFAGNSLQSPAPIWEVTTNCQIPNESQQGVCRAPGECPAYQRINDVASLGSVDRLSFLRLLQCIGIAEGQVCCPRSGDSYRQPSIKGNLPRRVHNDTVVPKTRIGAEPCGQQGYKMQLLGGEVTDIDEFPWMAMLIYDAGADPGYPVAAGCGGALVSNSFVVTAAHCLAGAVVQKKGNLKFVRLGEYNLLSDPDCLKDGEFQDCTDEKVDIKPKRIIVHPDYRPESTSQHHDIGLVQLAQPVMFSSFIQHICLPEPAHAGIFTPGTKMNVCGWGRTNLFKSQLGDSALSPVKLKAVLPYFDHNECRQIYRPQSLELGDGQMCFGGEKARDTCAGDSGSPLMFFDRKRGAWILTGLVSLGVKECGTEGKPGVYTNVKEYTAWIAKNMKS
ncbi:CLIP domain-containing serine protease B8-like [Toxorhynchites rutilus septentrionalis]|uniref:CLIP domain-containing serine protease B8-like n=1 Tax=Toxorhynchites rutilus septentrionalis TaxID=329112 RepID=UPI0024793060|nr:CLIP domain-containing serine protease B8-like [Toxorhynchites rutilus septentrionalis]